MAIKKVSQETRDAIKRKSAFALPNRPSEAGIKPEELKRAFFAPVTDAALSALGEVDRIAEETNDELNKKANAKNEALETEEKDLVGAINELKRWKAEVGRDAPMFNGNFIVWDSQKQAFVDSGIHKDQVTGGDNVGGTLVLTPEWVDHTMPDGLRVKVPKLTDREVMQCGRHNGAIVAVCAEKYGDAYNGAVLRLYATAVGGYYDEWYQDQDDDYGGPYGYNISISFLLMGDPLVAGKHILVTEGIGDVAKEVRYMLQDTYELAEQVSILGPNLEEAKQRLDEHERGLETMDRRIRYLESGSYYKDVTDEGIAYSIQMPSYSLPYAAVTKLGTGETYVRKRNLVKMPYAVSGIDSLIGKTTVVCGMERTIFPDGSIHFKGTCSGTTGGYYTMWLHVMASEWYPGHLGTCFLSGCPEGGGANTYFMRAALMYDGLSKVVANDYGSGATINLYNSDYCMTLMIRIYEGQTVDITFRPQLEVGAAATEWEPYTLKHSAVTRIVSRGANLLERYTTSEEWEGTVTKKGCKYFLDSKYAEVNIYLTIPFTGFDTYICVFTNHIAGSNSYPQVYFNGATQAYSSNTRTKIPEYLWVQGENGKECLVRIQLWTNGSAEFTVGIFENFDGELSNLYDIRDDIIHEIPVEIIEAQSDSYGYGIGENISYVDFENGKYVALGRVRKFQTGDYEDATVMTDGVQTVVACHEEHEITAPMPMVYTDPHGRIVFENEDKAAVAYGLKYQVKA